MKREVDVRAVQGILYGVYKSLHRIAGASAPAIMRQAAPDIHDAFNQLGVLMDQTADMTELSSLFSDTMKETGMCDEYVLQQDGATLRANISNCAFHQLTEHLREEGIPPFGCPFAAITLSVAEKNLGKRARVTGVRPNPTGKPGDSLVEVELS